MDSAPTPSVPIATFSQHSDPKNRLLAIALVTGLIASLVSGYLLWFGGSTDGLFSGQAHLVLAPRALPLFPAAVLDTGSQKLTPLTVEGQGTASIIGYAHGSGKDYYLLTSDGKTSNVFASDGTRGLMQLTNSPSLKLGLSYDPASGELAYAYVTGSASTTRIALLRQGTTTEESLTEGSNPILLKGGQFIVYEKDGSLLSINLSTIKKSTLLTIPKRGAYAVDPENLRVALYDPSTKTLQQYSISTFTSASAEKPLPAGRGFDSRLLAYVNGKLVQLYASTDALLVPSAKKDGAGRSVAGSGPYVSAAVTAYDK